MKKPTANEAINQIAECNKMAILYNTLYELLDGWDSEINPDDERILNKELDNGEINSLSALGKRFAEFSEFEYNKAERLLRTFNTL